MKSQTSAFLFSLKKEKVQTCDIQFSIMNNYKPKLQNVKNTIFKSYRLVNENNIQGLTEIILNIHKSKLKNHPKPFNEFYKYLPGNGKSFGDFLQEVEREKDNFTGKEFDIFISEVENIFKFLSFMIERELNRVRYKKFRMKFCNIIKYIFFLNQIESSLRPLRSYL